MDKRESDKNRRISIDLPNKLIEKFDDLKREWGLRARGAVLERLLEIVLSDEGNNSQDDLLNNKDSLLKTTQTEIQNQSLNSLYDENTALVLIPNTSDIIEKNKSIKNTKRKLEGNENNTAIQSVIDLPGFVNKRSDQLRRSLDKKRNNYSEEIYLSSIKDNEIENALISAKKHWLTLYGNNPKENVVEAAMTWLAIDIWNQVEGTDDVPFTWTAANKLMNKYNSNWNNKSPNFERVIVMAGILEDPFGTGTLEQRIPSLIRRFVNKFKRSNKVTSFQTIESTMTVHGALKFLGLPTYAGASLTLVKIRDAFKKKALSTHPDAGGTTDSMRRLNEAYQLLKELYREKEQN